MTTCLKPCFRCAPVGCGTHADAEKAGLIRDPPTADPLIARKPRRVVSSSLIQYSPSRSRGRATLSGPARRAGPCVSRAPGLRRARSPLEAAQPGFAAAAHHGDPQSENTCFALVRK